MNHRATRRLFPMKSRRMSLGLGLLLLPQCLLGQLGDFNHVWQKKGDLGPTYEFPTNCVKTCSLISTNTLLLGILQYVTTLSLAIKESAQERDLKYNSHGKHIIRERASSNGTKRWNAKLQETRVWCYQCSQKSLLIDQKQRISGSRKDHSWFAHQGTISRDLTLSAEYELFMHCFWITGAGENSTSVLISEVL